MNKAINCMFIILVFVMCISCGSYNTATMSAMPINNVQTYSCN